MEFEPFPLQPAADPDSSPAKDCEATCHACQNERNQIELKIEARFDVYTSGGQPVIGYRSVLAKSGFYFRFYFVATVCKCVPSLSGNGVLSVY